MAQHQSTGKYSTILGGSCNSDGGLNYAAVFGCNVTAVASCAFHANNFVAANMPSSTLGLPSGAFYKTVIGTTTVVAIVP